LVSGGLIKSSSSLVKTCLTKAGSETRMRGLLPPAKYRKTVPYFFAHSRWVTPA
jgi:hypothetical protein